MPTGHYDNDQINVLQAAHKQACKELCINKTDQVSTQLRAALKTVKSALRRGSAIGRKVATKGAIASRGGRTSALAVVAFSN